MTLEITLICSVSFMLSVTNTPFVLHVVMLIVVMLHDVMLSVEISHFVIIAKNWAQNIIF